jgi:hypothetical protein
LRLVLSGVLWWQGRRLFRTVGWLGVAAIIMAIAVALFHFWGVVPLRASLADKRDEAEHLRERLLTSPVVDTNQDPAAQLAEFYSFFPEGDVMTDTLKQIYATAAQENLVLEHGEYQLLPGREGKLFRYNLTLPIKGPYTRLRRFIAKILQDNPGLALEGVSFSRHGVIEIGVDAHVRMTLFLKSG